MPPEVSGKAEFGYKAMACASPARGITGGFDGKLGGYLEFEADAGGLKITGGLIASAKAQLRTRNDGNLGKCKCSNGRQASCTKRLAVVSLTGTLECIISDIRDGGEPELTVKGELEAKLNVLGYQAQFKTEFKMVDHKKFVFSI